MKDPLIVARKIAQALMSKYSMTTGHQLTEECASQNEVTLLIAEVLEREIPEIKQ